MMGPEGNEEPLGFLEAEEKRFTAHSQQNKFLFKNNDFRKAIGSFIPAMSSWFLSWHYVIAIGMSVRFPR